MACEPCESPWLASGVSYQRKFASARGEGGGRRSELHLGSLPCASLLCWPFVTGAACECGGGAAHILRGACGRTINVAFGRGGKGGGCRGDDCRAASHPSPQAIRDELAAWWVASRSQPPVFTMAVSPRTARSSGNSAAHGSRSTASSLPSLPSAPPPSRCAVPASRILELVSAHVADSEYIRRFVESPFLQEMLADEALLGLLAMRSRVKELSEGFAAYEILRSLVGEELTSCGGRGVVVFDVCSGKGLGSTLLSFLLPNARIIMLDANGQMELAHVKSRPNLSFHHVDIFREETVAIIKEEANGAFLTVALGMHLCGALSPRLIDLTFALDCIDVMVLCPCCLKGAHGKAVAIAAKARGVNSYGVLLETLQAICEREREVNVRQGQQAATIAIKWDTSMLSPKNAFITVSKFREQPVAPSAAELLQAAADQAS
ncbi:MAG: hypothetical protein SGPRY_006039 [Prymnesium sp.]